MYNLLQKVNVTRMLLTSAITLFCVNVALAQQNDGLSAGIKAPTVVKIDGKHTEWSILPGYNKSTTLSYKIANDATNLYLVIANNDQANINKMLGGGLTFTVNTQGKKKVEEAAVVIYPMPGKFNMRSFRGGRGRGSQQREAVTDTAAIVEARKQAVNAAKELSVTGIKDITDTLISIYNTYGIKTGITIDNKGNVFYELAVPLKKLGLSADNTTEIAYNIKLNGIQMNEGSRQPEGNRPGGGEGGGFGLGNGGGFGSQIMELMTPTDFWGKYKLAKP
jgi:hypothetical protein